MKLRKNSIKLIYCNRYDNFKLHQLSNNCKLHTFCIIERYFANEINIFIYTYSLGFGELSIFCHFPFSFKEKLA